MDKLTRIYTFLNINSASQRVSESHVCSIASLGFFHNGEQLECVQCNAKININDIDNEVLKSLILLHNKKSPECILLDIKDYEYVFNKSSVLTPYMEDPEIPKHPQYINEKKRIESFNDNVIPLGQSVTVLSNAGFYHTGELDEVCCHHCNGKIKDWTQNNDPWIEHPKYFPNCGFLRSKRTPEYIDILRKKYLLQTQLSQTDIKFKRVVNILNSENVTSLLNLGYTTQTIIEVILSLDSQNINDNALVREVMKRCKLPYINSQREIQSCASNVNEKLCNEYKTLEESLTCNICYDNSKSVALLPCGHCYCCNVCVFSMANCSICKGIIRGTVRVFL